MTKKYAFSKTIGDKDGVVPITAHRDLVAKIQKLENEALRTMLSNHLRRAITDEDYEMTTISYFPSADKSIIAYKGVNLFTIVRGWEQNKYIITFETLES